MRLHLVTWTEDDAKHRKWTPCEKTATTFGTAKKKELRDAKKEPKSVERRVVEVDTKKEGLIEFLNQLALDTV